MTTPDPLNVKFAAMTRAERLEWMKRYPPVRPEDVPDSWVTVAGDSYSMHGHGLLRNILSGVAPLIAAAERKRVRSMAIEHQATYRPYDTDLGQLIPGFDGQPGPDPLGDPFADLLGDGAPDG